MPPNKALARAGTKPSGPSERATSGRSAPGRSAQIPTGGRGILRTSLGTIQTEAEATRGGL